VDQLLDRLPAADREQVMAGHANGSAPRIEQDLLHGHYRTVRELAAARPVIVAIDDLHDADPLSIRWCS